MSRITGATVVAGVAGNPIRHTLSPLIHNAWLEAAGIDAVYVAFSPVSDGFTTFVNGLRGSAVRGLNVTLPFKEAALAVADRASERALAAEAANLLVFEPHGDIVADNTDGLGLLGALKAQAPDYDPPRGPAVVLGAGGAARGAVAALLRAGAPQVRIINRTLAKAEAVAGALGDQVIPVPLASAAEALSDAAVVINATSAGLSGSEGLTIPLEVTPPDCVVMDMLYQPLVTPFLAQAQVLQRRTVDGLEMLIRQAAPSFETFFGKTPDPSVDVRALAIAALEARR